MKKILNSLVIRTLVLLFAASVTFAPASAQDRAPFRQAELDQMLAPVALYPDSLLSQILMASTYPLEVVQAARWSRANPGLSGQEAVRAAEHMDWDPSVQSLTAFPQILDMMDEKLDWTEDLGEAFLAQQADVMDSVQALRRRAEAAGNLRSSEQMRIERQGEVIYIQQSAPGIIYVPYYNPVVVYGTWWWPAYPPVYWAPPRAYYVAPAYRTAFLWGSGVVISANFFFGQCDWQQRHVTVVNNYVTMNRTTIVNQSRTRVAWHPDPAHRHDTPFRHEAARERFEQSRIASADSRRDANRSGAPQADRHAGGNRTEDVRPRQLEDRRNTVQDHREDGRGERRESMTNRPAPNGDGNRAATHRVDEHAIPAAQAQPRGAQLETQSSQPERKVQPEARRPQPEARQERPDTHNARAERAGLQSSNRGPERSDATRPQARSVEPRPAATTPVTTTVAPPEARAARETTPAPRTQAVAPNRPSQAENNPQRGEARDHGNQRERSTNRDNDRKS